ncbi:MAG: hypothetical protein E4H19_04200 [Chromatiales bacterium]|jgi:cytoskeletal protein RodZ|nr:MAG: hypothetical protein E4H19_04200 [Chromatiales bacterium]
MVDGNKETTLGLGERLRSARKARALTLQQAAFTLRLEESVLQALEDERYDVLGAAVFVRGHLKAYARLLGLSEEVTLMAYRNSDPNADAPPKVTRELERPLTTTPGPTVILVAVGFALLAMLLVYVLSAGDEPVQPGATTAPGQEAVPTIELVPVLPPGLEQEPEAPPESVPEPADETVVAPVGVPPAVTVE